MNYTQIQTKISTLLKRGTSLDAEIPDWITYAEAEIESALRDVASFQTLSGTLTSGTDTVALVSTVLEPKAVYLTIGGEQVEVAYQVFLPPNGTATGQPGYWTVEGSNIRFDTLADQTYTVSISCYGGLDIASADNWVGDNVPNAYIYGALMHSTAMTGADSGLYSGFYQLAIDSAKTLNAKRRGINSAILRTDIPCSVYGSSFDIIRGY
jgi:hypothetical protein